MEIAAASLAAKAVSILAPALSTFLGRVRDKSADELGSKVGTEGWEQAKRVWAKLGPKVEAKPGARETAEKLAAHPDDEDLQAAMRVHLREMLNEDPPLRQQLTQIIGSEVQQGEGNVMTRGDVIGSTIIGQISTVSEDGQGRLPDNPIARALIIGGFFVCLAGIGTFFFTLISLMMQYPEAGDSGVPIGIPIGFGVFFAGFVLVAIGGVYGQLMKKDGD
jgi:hypothetical protein